MMHMLKAENEIMAFSKKIALFSLFNDHDDKYIGFRSAMIYTFSLYISGSYSFF